jgi:hypothetical protein
MTDRRFAKVFLAVLHLAPRTDDFEELPDRR